MGTYEQELVRDAYEETLRSLLKPDLSIRTIRLTTNDGLDMDNKRALEIMSSFTTQVHIDALLNGKIKPEYYVQCQFSMWVTGWDEWDFCTYDNRMRGKPENRLHTILQKRDNEFMTDLKVKSPYLLNEWTKH